MELSHSYSGKSNEIIDEIKCLDESKATQYHDNPTKVIKENHDIFANFLTENFNDMFENSVFPDSYKQANINPVYKKDFRKEQENYRPITILANLSKIYGRCMYTYMNRYCYPILSKYQLGIRKGYSA